MRNIVIYTIIALSLFQCKSRNSSHSVSTISSIQPTNGELIGNKLDDIDKKQEEFGMTLEFDVIEKLTLDLNGDNQEDIIEIERIRQWIDPGDFHRITIKISGKKKTEFLNTSGWVAVGDYETQFVKGFVSNTVISSKYVSLQQASENDMLLFCFGYTYASQPGLLSIINLLKQDGPKLIFNDNYHLYKFEDINNDGAKDITVTTADMDGPKEKSMLSVYELINGWFFKKLDQ